MGMPDLESVHSALIQSLGFCLLLRSLPDLLYHRHSFLEPSQGCNRHRHLRTWCHVLMGSGFVTGSRDVSAIPKSRLGHWTRYHCDCSALVSVCYSSLAFGYYTRSSIRNRWQLPVLSHNVLPRRVVHRAQGSRIWHYVGRSWNCKLLQAFNAVLLLWKIKLTRTYEIVRSHLPICSHGTP